MTDVTPSEYIFKELQAVHATGLLTDQLSLEDEWQQTFFEMDQVLSSSPNARINTNYNNNSNNNNQANSQANINNNDTNQNVADPVHLVSAAPTTTTTNQSDSTRVTSNRETTAATNTTDTLTTPSIISALIDQQLHQQFLQQHQRNKCEPLAITNQSNDTVSLSHVYQQHNNNSLGDHFNSNVVISSLSDTHKTKQHQHQQQHHQHHHHQLLSETISKSEQLPATNGANNGTPRLMSLITDNQMMVNVDNGTQDQNPTFYFCPTVVAPCDVPCTTGPLITTTNIVALPQQPQQQPTQAKLQPSQQQPQSQKQPQQNRQQQQQPVRTQKNLVQTVVFDKTPKQRSLSTSSSSATSNHNHNKSNRERPTRLDCPFCERTFCKNFDLQQHMRCHTGEKPFQCIVCGRGFAQKSNVKKHMQAHKVWPDGSVINANSTGVQSTNSRTNGKQSARSRSNSASHSSNPQCGSTVDPYNLDDGSNDDGEDRVGTMSDNTNSSLDGALVPFGFCNHRSDLSNGEDAAPTIDNRYSCSYCKFNGRTYFELKSHLTVHKREKVFKCIVSSCGQTFAGNDLQSFLEHVTSHKNELVYRCHLCSSQFNTLNELGYHQHEHNIITQANTHQLQQQQQIQQQQQQSAPYSTTTTNPEQHKQQLYQKQTRSEAQKYFRCSKCMNRYTTLTALEHHISISSHHYPCTECDKVFPCERYLRRHLNTHTSILHVCTYCDKQFKTAAYLKMHKIVHTGEKPFQCNLCDAAFNRRDKLNRHKLTHEPFKKYKCPFKHHTGCPKEFNRPDKLKAHILTHSGIRPHQCDICERSFSRQTHLREHKKLLHETTFNISQLTMDTNSSLDMQISSEMDIQDSLFDDDDDDNDDFEQTKQEDTR